MTLQRPGPHILFLKNRKRSLFQLSKLLLHPRDLAKYSRKLKVVHSTMFLTGTIPSTVILDKWTMPVPTAEHLSSPVNDQASVARMVKFGFQFYRHHPHHSTLYSQDNMWMPVIF